MMYICDSGIVGVVCVTVWMLFVVVLVISLWVPIPSQSGNFLFLFFLDGCVTGCSVSLCGWYFYTEEENERIKMNRRTSHSER